MLVTDDDPISLLLIEEALADLPIQCVAAASVREAKQIVLKAPPHIAILDVQLPDGDGTEILLEIRSQI